MARTTPPYATEEGELREVVVYALFRDEYGTTPCADAPLEAFDVAGGARVL